LICGDVAQSGERGVRNAEVEGSIPFISTKSTLTNLTSRNFYNLLKIKVFFKLTFLTRTWNNGMMEYWNDGLKKMTFLYLIPVKKNFTITQLSIFSMSRRLSEPEAQNPIFQCPNIPTLPRYIAG
jgi:hypothetical protein